MASPSEISDPFFNIKTNEQSANDDSTKIVSAQFSNRLHVVGQGTIAVKSNATSSLQFFVATANEDDPTPELCIRPEKVTWKISGLPDADFQWIKCPNAGFLCPGTETTYWLSINGADGIIRYGKRLASEAMTLYETELKNYWGCFKQKRHAWLARARHVHVRKDYFHVKPVIAPLPVLFDYSPWILSKDHVTLMEIDQAIYTSPTCLPIECRTLYDNITATPSLLDSKEYPEFPSAVQRSCDTPGYWGYERLRAQATENKTTLESSRLVFTLRYNLVGLRHVQDLSLLLTIMIDRSSQCPLHSRNLACRPLVSYPRI